MKFGKSRVDVYPLANSVEYDKLKHQPCTLSTHAGEQDKNRPRGHLHAEMYKLHRLTQERVSTVKLQQLNTKKTLK